jgi:type I restriction enzyme S subunit
MTDLPAGWVNVGLGDIVTLRGEKISPEYVPNAPFIGLEDIEPNTSRILRIGRGSDVKSSVAKFLEGDVLYSRLRPYLNKVTIADFDGIASAEILVLQPTAATTAEFVRRRIMAVDFLDFAAALDRGDRPRVNYAEISRFPVRLPPASEQLRIVGKIDGLSARVARARMELRRVPVLTERMRQSILKAAFDGELTAAWRSQSGAPDWKWMALRDVISDGPSNGWSPRSGPDATGALTLKLTATTSGYLRLDDAATKRIYERPPSNSKYWLRYGDLLVQRANSLEHVGASAIFDGPDNTYIYPDLMMRMRIDDRTMCRLIWYFLNSAPTRKYFRERATGTAGNMPKINGSTIRELPIPIPSQAEQKQLLALIDATFASANRLEADAVHAYAMLDRLDAAILAKAFRGELVPQDPNDEPASALLDRIRAEGAQQPKRARSGRPRKGRETVDMPRRLEEVLAEAAEWLPAQEAFRRCGVANGAQTDDIEPLYAELRALEKAGRLAVEPVLDATGVKLHDRLKLVAA